MSKAMITARLNETVVARLDSFASDRGLTRTEALETLIVSGVKEGGRDAEACLRAGALDLLATSYSEAGLKWKASAVLGIRDAAKGLAVAVESLRPMREPPR